LVLPARKGCALTGSLRVATRTFEHASVKDNLCTLDYSMLSKCLISPMPMRAFE
jgi:hypothetical protein